MFEDTPHGCPRQRLVLLRRRAEFEEKSLTCPRARIECVSLLDVELEDFGLPKLGLSVEAVEFIAMKEMKG